MVKAKRERDTAGGVVVATKEILPQPTGVGPGFVFRSLFRLPFSNERMELFCPR